MKNDSRGSHPGSHDSHGSLARILVKLKHTDLRIDKQKRCNFGWQKINNSRQETGFIFVIQVKDVFIEEIQVSCSYF